MWAAQSELLLTSYRIKANTEKPPSPDWMRDFITQDDWLCPLSARCPENLMIAGVAPAID
ncbi:hypothetical protein PGTUg99_035915 [Puccinia graminis f. sp. tritici]|uniref:Uncharacterized protein n=1 Tax=Puccinia graminis f. sp. tritici TaxID=56615 RepID=A0A5B0RGI8_PUCGR|nr:hypothetical protein PGTUg99_035915 [Puccinia graminis f. sp. tritici]